MAAFRLAPSPEAERLIVGLRAIAVLGAAIPLNHVVLKRLVAIVDTVRPSDPFVDANASDCSRSPGRCSPCSFSAA